MSDSIITAWNAKYYYNFWRPILGIFRVPSIHHIDQAWTSLEAPPDGIGADFTPAFQAYLSGDTAFGTAIFQSLRLFYSRDTILFQFQSNEYNGKIKDSNTGRGRPALTRYYPSLTAAEIENAEKNVSLNSAYFLGTVHVPQNLIWPYFSNDILNNSDEYWVEIDLTDPLFRVHVNRCIIDQLLPKQLARLRVKTRPQFLNDTKRNHINKSTNPHLIAEWRHWIINNDIEISFDCFWRNRTITDDTILDHRIILEAYRKEKYVGSLEKFSNTSCEKATLINKLNPFLKKFIRELISHWYNCDWFDDAFNEFFDDSETDMKIRNEKMVNNIRQILKSKADRKILFVVGAAHLFGNNSINSMLDEYHIKQIDSPSENFPSELCTQEIFEGTTNEIKAILNDTNVESDDNASAA
ncbi:unnamed protein product [Rotaria sordida]|uniref:Metalloprotease TIKI homolog n=1 Tax=Rotaria sordida TaxID=392033 RepID=A0A814QK11_9BILA|nr:unnamed protein product [Rotaria sordida]